MSEIWLEVLTPTVALRKESVDRNINHVTFPFPADVALRKESVDRNGYEPEHYLDMLESLSARRAWIEI